MKVCFHDVFAGATVLVNGKVLGNTTNQHRRYTFDVTDVLAPGGSNQLTVRFDRAIANAGTHPPLIGS